VTSSRADSSLHVHGLGHFHPETVLDNAFLESLDIGTNDAWIQSRTGIRSRRTVLPLDYIRATRNADVRAAREAQLVSTAETGRRAALMAIERAGISVADVGMVIAGTSCPDHTAPSEAAGIADALGADVPAFDLASACTTFGLQCHHVRALGDAVPDWVLLVVPENMTRVVDFSDRSSAVLFGDATIAAVVSTRHPAAVRIRSTTFGARPSGAGEVRIPRVGHFTQHGAVVQKFAIKKMVELVEGVRATRPDTSRRLVYVGHQANLVALESVARRCAIEDADHLRNIEEFGNTGAAGAPSVLSQRWGELRDLDVAVAIVGAGLSWSSLLLSA